MFRRRKLIIGLMVLLGLPALWILSEHRSGRRALEAWVKAAEARGEKLTIQENIPAPLPPDKNAAAQIAAATFLLESAWNVTCAIVPVHPAPGKVIWILPEEDWRGFQDVHRDATGTNLNWRFVSATVGSNAVCLRNIQAALRAGRLQYKLNYAAGFDLGLPHLGELNSACQWLSASALVDLRAGERGRAMAALTDAATLIRMQNEEPFLITQLVRFHSVAVVIDATWQALQSPEWTEAELTTLQQAWDSWSTTDGMLPAFSTERAFVRNEANRCREDTERLMDITGFSRSQSSSSWMGQMMEPVVDKVRGKGLRAIYGPLWRTAWADRDELRYLEEHHRIQERARRALNAKSLAAAAIYLTEQNSGMQIDADLSVRDVRYPISSLAYPEGFTSACIKAARAETRREMLVAAIALKRHQLKHGRYPDILNALVPEFLGQLPIDSMDGKALRYRAKEDGTYVLYSIGEDGKDNGGDATKLGTAGTRTQDIVWPWPATEMEVEAFVAERAKEGKRR